MKIRVEMFKGNNWIRYSYHRKRDVAIRKARTLYNKQYHSTRVIENGSIIWMSSHNVD